MKTDLPRFVVHALPGDHGQELATALAEIATDGKAGPASLDDAAEQLTQDPARLRAAFCLLRGSR